MGSGGGGCGSGLEGGFTTGDGVPPGSVCPGWFCAHSDGETISAAIKAMIFMPATVQSEGDDSKSLLCRSGKLFEPNASQAQGVADDRDGAEPHGGAGDHGAQEEPE